MPFPRRRESSVFALCGIEPSLNFRKISKTLGPRLCGDGVHFY